MKKFRDNHLRLRRNFFIKISPVKIDRALCRAVVSQSPSHILTVQTMSSSSSAVSFYKSDLEVMTAFVQDRSKFLDTVVDAITLEGKDAAADKMVSLLEHSAFLQFMPALLADKSAEMRSKALQALGNLICSDNAAIASAAFKVAERDFGLISSCARDADTMASGVYVAYTMAFRINSLLSDKKAPMIAPLVSLAKDLVKEHRTCVARDMLYVLKTFGTCTDVHTCDLIALAYSSSKLTRRTALAMLADQVSGDNFDTQYCDDVYDILAGFCLDMHAGKKHGATTRHEVAWTLSNLVTEDGIADRFFQDKHVFEAIVEKMLFDPDCSVAAENAWVLVNAVATCDVNQLKGNFLQRLRSELNNYKNSRYILNASTKKAVAEALEKIETAIKAHADAATKVKNALDALKEPAPVPCVVPTPALSAISMEVDDDACWSFDNKPVPQLWNLSTERPELWNLPCERPEPFMPPTAYELLAKGFARKATSKVVYDLIRSVEANSNTYTPIPKDTRLTVEDLTTLEDLGFSIVRGCIGINTAIVNRFYAN
jgi:hypothetical protein